VNAVRLAVGTLTILPTPPPSTVDQRVAGRAMVLAPVVGLVLAAPLWLLSSLVDDRWSAALVAVLWVGGLALLTRGLHLDGLADTADGLGSNKPAARALEIMRHSDVGPFGVATLVLVLLAQVMAAAQLLTEPDGLATLAAAVVLSRLVVPLVCRYPAAREGGLGSMVAGSVTAAQAGIATLVTALLCVAVVLVGGPDGGVVLAGLAGPVVGLALCLWCVRRLGGITGDVIGACVEATFTASLLAMALV